MSFGERDMHLQSGPHILVCRVVLIAYGHLWRNHNIMKGIMGFVPIEQKD